MNVSEMQRKLYAKAIQEKEHKFSNLYSLMTNDAWLETAYEKVSSNRGSNTAGVDRDTKANFEQDKKGGMERLKFSLKDGSFKPSPVRRVYIREVKASGRVKMRPIGIPTLRDRIVQEAVRMILEPIFEPDFSRHSYGFRPRLSTHKAMAYVFKVIQPHTHNSWIIEGDISSYFDTVNHKLLMRLLKRSIKDKRLLDLIWKFLRSGIMEEGVFRNATIGTPQGGIGARRSASW